MPKSVTIPFAIALIGTAIYAYCHWGATPALDDQNYILVAVSFFNLSTLIALTAILYQSEKNSAEDFGKIMRDNISTIVVSLLINIVTSTVDIFKLFA